MSTAPVCPNPLLVATRTCVLNHGGLSLHVYMFSHLFPLVGSGQQKGWMQHLLEPTFLAEVLVVPSLGLLVC